MAVFLVPIPDKEDDLDIGQIRSVTSRHKITGGAAIDRESTKAYTRHNTSLLMENILEYAITDIGVV